PAPSSACCLLIRAHPPHVPPLVPYTTLFRSARSRTPRPGRGSPPDASRRRMPGAPRRASPRPVGTVCDPEASATPRSRAAAPPRSEEHTSELQSRENLVCRLLLEKKKKRTTI